jgi:flagellar biosynthesis/type III secretory pathway M-ring protein FliF/YscJ
MDEANWGIMNILGPVLLLAALLWLVMRRRASKTTERTEEGTRDLYAEEEARRREGTDDL